jgi:hypothetical protein
MPRESFLRKREKSGRADSAKPGHTMESARDGQGVLAISLRGLTIIP